MAPNTHGGGVYVGCASIRRRPLFVSVPQIGFGKTMRTQLYKRVADYMFAIYQWISGHGPMPFEPKAPGLFVDLLEGFSRELIKALRSLCRRFQLEDQAG